MRHFCYLLTLLVSCIAAVLSDPDGNKQLIKIIENESDKECLANKNVDLSNALTDFQFCVQQVSQKFQQSMYSGQAPTDPAEAVVKFLCNNPDLTKCITNMEETFGVCLNSAKKKLLSDQFKPLYAMIDFACEDNGQPIKDMINHGAECLAAKKYGIMQCVHDVTSVMTPQTAETFEDLKTEEGCKHAKTIQTCVVQVLSSCSDDTASKFFDSLFNSVLKNSHCAEYMDTNTV